MRSAPPRALTIGCLLALLVAVIWLHHEVLLSGQVYHMDDAADGYYPSHVAILQAYRHLELPTWERGSWAGWPLVADPYYGAFYPGTILFALFGATRGLGVSIAAHVLYGAIGMLVLLRRRGLGWGPALLGAASLGFSSFMVVRIRHVIFVEAMAWLPWALAGIEGWLPSVRREANGSMDRRVRDLVLAALATGMALLCGALPLAPFLALIGAAFVLPRLARADERPLRSGLLVLAAVVGLALAAAQIFPTVAHMRESPRALGADFAFASSYAWPGRGYLATLLAPDFYGTDDRGRWFGLYNHWELAGYYAGAWVILLSPLGLLRARKRPELIALFAMAALAILLAFGERTPVHGWFFRHVPLYATLRCPVRALVMLLAATPILAAEGLAWLEEHAGKRRVLVGAALAVLFAAGGIAFAVALGKGSAHVVGWPRLLRYAHAHGWHDPAIAQAMVAGAHLAAVVAIGAALLTLLCTRVLPDGTAALGLALLTLVELVLIGRGYVQPKPADYPAGMERFAAVDWLIAQRPASGVMDRFAPDPWGPFRLHNVGMVYGLESASGYDSVSVWRYVNFLQVLNTGGPYPYDRLKDDLAAGDIKRWGSPLVDLLNVRWAISGHAPAPGWVERFHPKPGAPLHATYEPLWDPQLGVWENPHPLPRAFVVYAADVQPDDAKQARALAGLDPRKRAILDRAPAPLPVGDGRPFTPARVTLAARQRLVIEAEASAPGILVVSETDYPGWSVTVDGKDAPLLRADYAFRGVALAAGKHTVEMRFRSIPTRLGLLLSLVGLFGLWGLARLARRG